MRRLMASALVAVMASPGCALPARRGQAGVQMPTGALAALVHDWSALSRLPHGAHVLVELDADGLVDAKVESVSDTALAIRRGDDLKSLPRTSVVRVIRIESMSGIRAKQGAWGGLLIGGLAAFSTGGALWFAALLSPAEFAGFGAVTGLGEQRQTLVYERR
jgi:hypothetical protein